ncbi:hypothetical protein HanIR_Chr04g0181441 [Helianthus annuus]|nr:hypothetical protein HanIR_Chr04g0181441 [Helianthus annuus]
MCLRFGYECDAGQRGSGLSFTCRGSVYFGLRVGLEWNSGITTHSIQICFDLCSTRCISA